MSDKVDHYLRLQFLLTESCQVLRQFFDKQCRNDTRPGLPYTDLDSYLIFHEPDIKSLVTRKILRQGQYDLLFLISSPVTLDDLDVTLLSALLINLYTLQPTEESWVKNIRELRNKLSHYGDITAVTDVEFNDYWNKLEGATICLANTINPTYATDVSNSIIELKTKVLTPSIQFLLEIIRSLSSSNHDVIQGLKDELNELKRSTGKTESYLRNVVKVANRRNDPPSKKVKTYDNRLDKMQKRFSKTMSRQEMNPENDEDSRTMYEKLIESRVLYVTGSKSSLYKDAVFGAIKKLNLDESRCAELRDLSEWLYIDSEYIDLVLIRNPLGTSSISYNFIEDFHRELDRIKAELNDLEDKTYLVITSDQEYHTNYVDILHRCNKEPHYLLKNPTRFQNSEADNTQTNAEIKSLSSLDMHRDSILRNLIGQTRICMNRHRTDKRCPEYDRARAILELNKVIRINGPRSSGKTVLGTQLMYNYPEDKCAILRNPNDISHLDFDDLSIIMIDDVGGKYASERDQVLRWYKEFDFLLQAVQAGKLSVIVITETRSFDACQLPVHDLLSSSLTLTLTKPEIEMEASASLQGHSMNMRDGEERSLWDASFDKISTLKRGHYIRASTFLPDGRLILVLEFYPQYTFELIDRDLSQSLAKLTVHQRIHDISAVSNTEVIITQGHQYLHLINVSTNLTLGHKIDLGRGVVCYSVDVLNDEIYTGCDEGISRYVRVLSRHGEVLKQIDVLSLLSSNSFYIKVGRNGNKVFLSPSTANQFVCVSIEGNVLYRFPDDNFTLDVDGSQHPSHIYVDDNDNVLVYSNWPHNFRIINNDGIQNKELLDEDETEELWSLSYRKADGLLVLGAWRKLFVYKARW